MKKSISRARWQAMYNAHWTYWMTVQPRCSEAHLYALTKLDQMYKRPAAAH